MSVRNILDELNDDVEIEHTDNIQMSFTGPFFEVDSAVTFYRHNKFVLIYLSQFYSTGYYVSEIVSKETVDDLYLPRNIENIIPSFALIWNGDKKIGLLYVGTDKKIHISGDTVVGSSFDIPPSSDPVVGVERGCVLSYFV